MPIKLGPAELILILVLVVLFFGVGRISKISGEIGRSIHDFREALARYQDQDEEE